MEYYLLAAEKGYTVALKNIFMVIEKELKYLKSQYQMAIQMFKT